MEEKQKKFPEGHFVGMWIGIGMAIFSGIGVPISIALDNSGLIGIGPAIGVAFGAGVGASIEAKKKQEGLIRPLTEDEKIKRKRLKNIGLGILIIGFLALLTIFLLIK
jgi:hypothetical protein